MSKSETELNIPFKEAGRLETENEQWAGPNETLLAVAVKRKLESAPQAPKAEKRAALAVKLYTENAKGTYASAGQVKQPAKEITEIQIPLKSADQRADKSEAKQTGASNTQASLKQHPQDHFQGVPHCEEDTKVLPSEPQESSPLIGICLCTHNPRREVLDLVLRSIAAQNIPEGGFLFLMVDNASTPAVPESVLTPLRDRGISNRLVREPRPGIFHARNRAMRESQQPLILWVDDDTEFPPDHVAKCLAIARQHPEIGCFGGKLRMGPHCRSPAWTVSLHPWLAIVDRGEEPITRKTDQWGFWEPPTAGAVVRREVIARYLDFVDRLPPEYCIGQVGAKNLMRGEDSLLMRMAHRAGFACSYQPSLWGIHHLDNRRFRLRFLLRLLYGYGRSYVRLERVFGNDLPPLTPKKAWTYFWTTQPHQQHPDWRIILLMKAWNLGYLVERTVRFR